MEATGARASMGASNLNGRGGGTPKRRGDLATALGSIRPEWWLQGLIAVIMVAYGVSTLVVHRPTSGYNTFWDGWVQNIASALPVIPLLLRARRSPRLRWAWLAMAAGVMLYTLANLVYLYHDENLRPIPSPAPSDAFYLSCNVAFIVGFAILTQSSFGRVHASVRLDGAIAGLAIAAVAGVLWFEPVLHLSGRPFQAAVDLAYPVCALVLLVLLVAGLAPHRYRPNRTTVLLMTGVASSVVGSVIFLNQSASGTYVAGTLLGMTWLMTFFFIGLAASVGDRRRSGGARASVSSPAGIAVVPVVFGAVSLAVLATSIHWHDTPVVLILATSALGLVICRMAITLREVRQSMANYQDARTDYLTGLPNRRAFVEGLESTFSSEQGANEHTGVLLVDLDGFKEINDALGHTAGDELLCVVAKRFERRLGSRGVLARLGGDEYACSCPVSGEEALVAIAHELAESLSDPCVLEGMSVRVGASIGVALSHPDTRTDGELLRRADVAMYQAKRSQSAVTAYRSEADPNSRERLSLIDALRDAISSQTLVLHYQPTLDMRTGTINGVEALVRWQHPSLGLLYPDSFIPLAEQNGMMPQLTRAVLDMAVGQAARLERAGHLLGMSVNISRYDVVDEDLASYVDRVLALHCFPAARLTLEITESALGGDPERVERCVRQLRARGLRVSIDDFGVGYSSMSQLLGLSIDELKIDKSFTFGLTSDPRAEAIVRSTIELARALGLTLVAEGIETEEVLRSLQSLGADIGQGYLISRPLTPQQLDEYLAQPSRLRRLLLPAPQLVLR
jgi:diguanylate cyclase (GGDEF)-like protein